MTGLSSLALALSVYLGWRYLTGGPVIGCNPGSPGCNQVLKSRWSTIGGVLPVSGLAAGTYLAMLVASLSIGPATTAPVRRLAWCAMLVLGGAAAGSAVWFIILQKWVIGTFCPYCLTTHLLGLLVMALVIWRAPIESVREDMIAASSTRPAIAELPVKSEATSGRLVGRVAAFTLAMVGLSLAGILALCQVGIAPPTVDRAGDLQPKLPAMDPHAVPLIGSPEAPYVVNLLFDYKCPHCQQLHFLLDATIRRYGGKLAFALCPTPLNRDCNRYIRQDVDEFRDSCALAKVGLAVWLADAKAFATFDNWMFAFESGDRWQPRSLEAARAKAIDLVGQAKFEAAWADSWVDRYLQSSIRIYGDTLESGNGAIPKLVFASRWVIPEPNNADDLVSLLQNKLSVPKP